MDRDNRDPKPNLVTQSHMLGMSLPPLCLSFLLYSKEQEDTGRLASSPGGHGRVGSWEWALVTLLSRTWGT